MEDEYQLLIDFSKLSNEDLLGVNSEYVKRVLRIVCLEIIRLRAVEAHNAPAIRASMMHMPFG